MPDERNSEARPRELGGTGLRVSRLGLGLAALGRPGYINLGHADDLAGQYDVHAMQARAFRVLDAAFASGVRYFDAARSYGLAEDFLSAWLRQRQLTRADVTVGSKWGYTYTAEWRTQAPQHEVKDHSLANFERQWPQTRERLGAWLGVYMVHSVTPDSPVLADPATLERLGALRREGVTVGLSLSGTRQSETLARALRARARGEAVFSVVQATWNLLEPSAGTALAEAHADGWGVIVKEAVANGRLTPRGEEARHPAMRAACERYGVTPDVIALAGVLAQPWADVVLSGATTEAQLASNAEALRTELDEDTLAALARLRMEPETYWASRSRLAWN